MCALFDERDLIQPSNLSTRIPVVLCLDTSGSMRGNGGFDALNKGVRAFYRACKDDPVNRYGFDVAIVTFGAQGVEVKRQFRPIWDEDEVPEFAFSDENWVDGTPLAGGVSKSLELLSARKDEYRSNAIGYYQPFLVVITDGFSTEFEGEIEDPQYSTAFRDTQATAVELQRNRKLKMIALGVGNASWHEELSKFILDQKVLLAEDFSAFDLVFEFMSKSISTSSENSVLQERIEESILTQIMDDLEDEGIVSICIEDFSVDRD